MGHVPEVWTQLNNNDPSGATIVSDPQQSPPRRRTVAAHSSRIVSDLCGRVSSRCRCRPAGRPTPSAAGPVPVARAASQRGVGDRARRGRARRRCTAPRPARRLISRGGAPSRALRPARRPARRGRPRSRRRRVAIASSADTHASRTGSRGGADPSSSSPRPPQRRRRRREPAHAERVGGQPDQGVGAGLGVVAGQRQRPAVPPAGPVVPAELTQERRAGCCAPATPAGRRAARRSTRQVGHARCRSGPDRRRRRRAATARAASTPAAAASVPGRRRRRRSPARCSSDRRRYQCVARNPVPAGTRSTYRRISIG